MKTSCTFTKFDGDKRIAYGEVYAPNVPDSQGDFMVAEEIERMAHRFLSSGKVNEIDTEHDMEANGCRVVESFVARKGDPDFTPGAWVMGVLVPEDKWEAVKKGEFGGFSMYGSAMSEERVIEIEIPDDGILRGVTQGYDGHSHGYVLKFDSQGNFLGGETDDASGHSHKIQRGTVTEEHDGHRHRFSFLAGVQS